MKIIGLMPVRNEDWIIGLSARAALLWMDELIVLNHASTDQTADILIDIAAHEKRLTILNEYNPVWDEMTHRQKLLEAARERGATHCAILDADEILTGTALNVIRDSVAALAPGCIGMLPWHCMWRSPFQVRVDSNTVFHGGQKCVAFADHPALCWKAANGYQHHHSQPYNGRLVRMRQDVGGVMHLQFADWPRIIAKHARYKMIERVRWPNRATPAAINRQYDATLDERGLMTAAAPVEWWEPYRYLLGHLHLDRRPWQAEDCARMFAEHGFQKFAGLKLYGVLEETCGAL